MRTILHGGFGTMTALGCLLTASGTSAHPVTADGDVTEWSTRAANARNLGIIVRDAQFAGEYVWSDALGDTRTDVSNPEVVGDIAAFQVTGSPTGVGFLLRRTPGTTFTGAPIQVQVAIDTDQIAGNGQEYLAGYADTKVADGARWERLVQTLFGSGGAAQVLDSGFNKVADAQAVQGSAGDVEIFVPWTALGWSGPPTTPLRFTVATFRAQSNDITIDIGGPNVSNAVDVISDDGDPAATGYPNSWQELQDATVDYSFDLWFGPTGEVYAPLVIQRFIPNVAAGGSDEWISIRNVTGVTLPLGNVKIGDEETPDGSGEGMRLLPSGATLAPGAEFVLAVNGTSYQTYFGVPPDAETTNSSAGGSIPDTTAFTPWASSNIALANAGDEVLVLDRSNTILDIATYGNGTYAGITNYTPAPGAGIVLLRNAQSSDTDDCKKDFSPGTQCANNSHCGGSCRECTALHVCADVAAGTSCADSDLCNGNETCNGAGQCIAGTPLDCDDGKPCTTDSCVPSTGCSHVNLPAGASCSNNNACDGAESCDGNGTCQAGTPLDCTDADPCTVDSCNPNSGCTHTQAAPGTSCSNGNACDGMETCNSQGACVAGAPPTCSDANPCTADSCDPATGCVYTPLATGTPCGNNNVCDGDETCDGAGTCVAGTPLSCDDGNDCTADGCDPSSGCTTQIEPAGTPCAGSGCTGECDSTGVCVCGTGGVGGDGGSGGGGGSAGAAGTGGDGGAAGSAGAGGAAGSAGAGGSEAGSGGSTGGAGGASGGSGGASGGSGGGQDAGVGATGGSPSLPPASSGSDEGGCGCATPRPSQSSRTWWAVALAALALIRSKRGHRRSN
jgi:hypothetical protein